MTFNYDVTEDTRVYVYAANDNAASARAADADNETAAARTVAPRRAAYANDNSVKIYGLTITVDENANGISNIANSDTYQKDGKFIDQNRVIIMKKGVKYDVAGQRVKK